MALKQRINKLENNSRTGPQPIIVFYEGEKSGAKAIAEWEAENESPFNPEPLVVEISRFSHRPC